MQDLFGKKSSESRPLIVVKRRYFEEFVSGTKTIEYRRHRGQFTARTFYPGRLVRIAYTYNIWRTGWLDAVVERFETRPAAECPAGDRYEDMKPDARMALIHLRLIGA